MPSSAEDVLAFVGITGASPEEAERLLKASGGDVQQAILMFFENAEDPNDDIAEPPPPSRAAASAPSPAGAPGSIDSILGLANAAGKGGKDGESSADKGKGKGKGKDDGPMRKIAIVFFADGFMVDDEPEEAEDSEDEAKDEAPKPFVRRAGMMTLDSFKAEGKGGDRPKLPKKIPKLGPLRSYDTAEGKAFLEAINSGRVPKELQKTDAKGKPMYTTIAVSDERPKTYAELSKLLDQLKKMKDEQEAEDKQNAPKPSTMFTGAGQTCSSSSAASPAAVAGTGACDPELLRLIKGGPAPVVDETKPATTLQIRLSSGARVKARLNMDHTVADLWRLVSKEMGDEVFATTSGHELCAGFPPKPLKDNSVTLSGADLANASVTHRCQK